MNKKIISLILMFVMIGELMFTSMPAAKASGYLEIKATATSMTSVKITWKAQKGVTQYKIYRATENKNGNVGKYKVVATISGKKKSYTDKKLKTEKTYSYMVRGYKNKKCVIKTGVPESAYTGLTCSFDEYQFAEAPRSPKSITLKLYSSGGVLPTGYEIYRKEMGISGYKKIATTKKSVTSLSYKDKTVKAGKTYRYKVRTYLKVGKKKYYSAFTDYEQISATNRSGKYTFKFDNSVKCADNETVYKITSKAYNDTLKLYDNAVLTIELDDGSTIETGVDIISYRKGDGTWKKYKSNQSLTLKANETLRLKVRATQDVKIKNLKNVESYELNMDVTYGGISSFLWAYPYAGIAKTVMNSEAIH